MAVSVVSVKCPACGAELSVEDNREFSFCSYCGTKVMLSNNNEHIYRNIDDARIKEAETDRVIRLKELEIQEREAARQRIGIITAYIVALLFVLAGAAICLFISTNGSFGIMIGVYIALLTFTKSNKKDSKA